MTPGHVIQATATLGELLCGAILCCAFLAHMACQQAAVATKTAEPDETESTALTTRHCRFVPSDSP